MGEKSCGDIDPGIVLQLMDEHQISLQEIDNILKNKSGFFGLTGYDLPLPKLLTYFDVDKKVEFAFNVYINQIKKYIGEELLVFQACLVEQLLHRLYPVHGRGMIIES